MKKIVLSLLSLFLLLGIAMPVVASEETTDDELEYYNVVATDQFGNKYKNMIEVMPGIELNLTLEFFNDAGEKKEGKVGYVNVSDDINQEINKEDVVPLENYTLTIPALENGDQQCYRFTMNIDNVDLNYLPNESSLFVECNDYMEYRGIELTEDEITVNFNQKINVMDYVLNAWDIYEGDCTDEVDFFIGADTGSYYDAVVDGDYVTFPYKGVWTIYYGLPDEADDGIDGLAELKINVLAKEGNNDPVIKFVDDIKELSIPEGYDFQDLNISYYVESIIDKEDGDLKQASSWRVVLSTFADPVASGYKENLIGVIVINVWDKDGGFASSSLPVYRDANAPRPHVYVNQSLKDQEQFNNDTAAIVDKIVAGDNSYCDEETSANIRQTVAQGKPVYPYLYSEEIVNVDAKDRDLVYAIVGEGEYVYYDFSVRVSTDDAMLGSLTKLDKAIEVTFRMPLDLLKEGRNYQMVRIHNGVAEKIPTTVDKEGNVTFTSDRFSTYVLTYNDKTNGEDTITVPDTEAGNKYVIVGGLLSVSVIGVALAAGLKKKYSK